MKQKDSRLARLGVIGYPIRHSISPAFQQAALDEYGLPARYERYEVPPHELPRFLDGVRGEEWMGINVTIPHKQAVIPALDSVDELAGVIGSVNTIVRNPDGSLWGCTTDVSGFTNALCESGFDFPDTRAVLLGTGGTARALVAALVKRGADAVTIVGRSEERARDLLKQLRRLESHGSHSVLRVVQWTEATLQQELGEAGLLVNTTPIGMLGGGAEGESPVLPTALHPRLTVFDAVYNPIETPLLAQARRIEARTVSGLEMLVHQGASAFELWTGRKAPIEVMRKAAREALEG